MLGIFIRTLELVETVFFVLRKKQNQVSHLHVYHHVSTILLLWAFYKYNASKYSSWLTVWLITVINIFQSLQFTARMELFILILNSIIHVIMYSYYLLTAFKVLDKYLKKFKPIMTSMQLVSLQKFSFKLNKLN